MTDNLVDTRAETLREVIVVQRRRVGIVIDKELMHCFVDIVGLHARTHHTMSQVECLTTEQRYFSQLLDVLRTLHVDHLTLLRVYLFCWNALRSVVRLTDVIRDCESR